MPCGTLNRWRRLWHLLKKNSQKSKKAIRANWLFLGEAGWCTDKLTTGEQAERLRGTAGEDEQAQFYHSLREWCAKQENPGFLLRSF